MEKREEIRKHLSEEANALLSDHDVDRFTRARAGDITKIVNMIQKWHAWWNTPLVGAKLADIDRGLKTPGDYVVWSADLDEQVYIDMMPHSNMGYDKDGSPAYWERTGDISSRMGDIKKLLTEDDLVIRHVRQQEMCVHRCRIASAKFNRVIEKQIIVMDLSNLSYSLDTTALGAFRRTLAIDEAFYPERLKALIMINVPWYFTAMWAIIKPWVDPVTAEKFQLVRSGSYREKLKEYFDDDNIPEEYGGTAKFGFQFPHNMLDSDKNMPGPSAAKPGMDIYAPPGDAASAVGTVGKDGEEAETGSGMESSAAAAVTAAAATTTTTTVEESTGSSSDNNNNHNNINKTTEESVTVNSSTA